MQAITPATPAVSAAASPLAVTFVNIAAYKFITLADTEAMRPLYQEQCLALELKGTILLTPEGINMFLSGTRAHIDNFLAWVRSDARLADLEWKESLSNEQSHKRMLVKLKKEIITMRLCDCSFDKLSFHSRSARRSSLRTHVRKLSICSRVPDRNILMPSGVSRMVPFSSSARHCS